MKHVWKPAMLAVGLCLLLLAGGCVTAKQKMLDAGINPLTDEQLRVLFSKPTDVSYIGNKGNASIKHSPDGTQMITYSGGSDEGFWRIANGEICGKWKNIRQGSEDCNTMFQVEDNKYKLVSKAGSVLGTLTFK
jgi:hypothetical protein